VFSGGYLLKESPEHDVDLTLPKEIEQFDKPRNPGNKVQECDEYPIGVP